MSRTGEYLSREDIQVKPIGASFGFYDADDLRRVSVLAITNASSRCNICHLFCVFNI